MSTLLLGMPRIHRDPSSAPDTTGAPTPPDWSIGSAASPATCASRSPRSARCAARTACRPRVCPASRRATCSPRRRSRGWSAIAGRDLGVHEVRFTGGEPLTRADLVEIIARSSAAAPGMPLSMTTNGIGLDKVADAARRGGPRTGQRLGRHDRPRAFRPPDPTRPPAGRARRHRRRGPRRTRTDQAQRRADARDPRRCARAAGVGSRARPAAAVHRGDAAGCGCRMAPRATWCRPPSCSRCSRVGSS